MSNGNTCRVCYSPLSGRQSAFCGSKCNNAWLSQQVGDCDVCGYKIRRRDGDQCGACYQRERREAARAADPVPCAVSWCEDAAYPGMTMCSKHRNDMYRYGEARPFKWRWSEVADLIPQSEVAEWRDRFLEDQGGRCGMFELCGKDESNNDTWHLDHDHSCEGHSPKRMCPKCVRGTLCWFCNVSVLGALEKDGMSPLMAARAVMRYLESGDQLKLAV